MMVPMYLLDSDVVSLYFRNQKPALIERINSTPAEQIAVSVITAEEQLTGWLALAHKPHTPQLTAYGYEEFANVIVKLGRLRIVGFSPLAQTRFTLIRKVAKNVGGNDLRIAAIALEMGATVVTRNVRDFERVPDLRVENWAD